MYAEALARVRDVLAFYASRPEFLPRSLELEDCARAAARAALLDGVSSAALSQDLGRLVVDALPGSRDAALEAGRAMARWAAREYHEASGTGPADAAS